jgi:23S rRNA (cytidine1920-2'-O)/16S rRNA (cytidine1409-2'-O)-methyltransferase
MRLDEYLAQKGMAPSRSQAADYIRRGDVSVGGKTVTKPAYAVSDDMRVELAFRERFVSRGGEKLAQALKDFAIDPAGKTVLDIGSSTGGFTDCLLSRGAARVVAVDVGTGQLAEKLRADPRVELHESTDIRSFSAAQCFGLVVIDVSFISLSYILPKAAELACGQADIVALVKPQFEVGKDALDRDGIVRDRSLQLGALEKVRYYAEEAGFEVLQSVDSPIEGGSGNCEFLLHLKSWKVG